MSNNRRLRTSLSVGLAVFGATLYPGVGSGQSAASLNPGSMPRIGAVEERFQAYNVEMLEITGGRFWKPYKDLNFDAATKQTAGQQSNATPAGMDPNLYAYRPPIDLSKCSFAQNGGGVGADIRARKWHLGKQHVFL